MTKQDASGPVDPLAEPGSPMDEASDELISNEAVELRSQLEEAKERALRLHADWENYRKRARRELEDERRFADLSLLTDLLPVLDNMQRAIDAASKTADGGGLLEGFRLVKQQLDNVIAQHHCKRIEALGKPFDPHLHEAVSQHVSPTHEPGTVIMVVRDGYQLHERVVRPAQVIVSAVSDG
ncbi:MAG TPA: nucleotide exchange factor GrpE [Pirellulales bacterium]|jgi:molecular chaperone GrpE